MAKMSEANKIATMRSLVRKMFTELGSEATMNTDHVKAAIDWIDQFMATDTVATLNAAGKLTGIQTIRANLANGFPEPFASKATLAQKYMALAFWAMKEGGII